MSGLHDDLEKKNTRLRKEVRLLREEREVLKKHSNPVVSVTMWRLRPLILFPASYPLIPIGVNADSG